MLRWNISGKNIRNISGTLNPGPRHTAPDPRVPFYNASSSPDPARSTLYMATTCAAFPHSVLARCHGRARNHMLIQGFLASGTHNGY